MRKRWKFISLLLVAALVVSACSSGDQGASGEEAADNADTADGEKELYRISVLTSPNNANITSTEQTPIGQVIKEKFNIVIDLVPFSGNYRDQLNVMLAGGDYPELLQVERQDLVKKYIQAGAAVPLDDYLDDMPNFTKRYEETIPYWRMAAEDGKLYKWEYDVPQDVQSFCECHDIAVRSDILEEAGYPELLSASDYVNFLKKALQDHPETNGNKTIGVVVPFAESWGMGGVSSIMFEKGEEYISVGNEGVIFNWKEERFEDMFLNEGVKESYKFLNDLYREGLLDDESFTDTAEQVKEKLQNGQALSVFYYVWAVDNANKNLEQAGHPELQYQKLPIQTDSQVENGEKRLLRLESTRPYSSVILTDNAKHPERIIELLDWAASEEGQLLLNGGIEGKHYEVKDGQRVPTEEFEQGYMEDPDYLTKEGFGLDILGAVRSASPEDGQPYYLLHDINIYDDLYLPDRLKEVNEKMGWENSRHWWLENGIEAPAGLASAIIIDPASEIGTVHQQITDFRIKNTAKLIMAESDEQFEQIYNDLVEQYKKLNPEQVIDKYNELYQEQKEQLEKVQ